MILVYTQIIDNNIKAMPVDFKEKEKNMWKNLPILHCDEQSKKKKVLKLVVNGHAFYSIVRDGKCLELRQGSRIFNQLTKNAYTHVIIYHGYFDKDERPYIIKEFKGAVVADKGVDISYPLMDVCTPETTYCIRLGDIVEYFNPQTIEKQEKYLNSRLKGKFLSQK
jgi:hypothetical protein